MTWIKTIAYENAGPKLRKLYNRVKDADNQVDRILMSHSLRPGSLQGHMTLYKNVLHHSECELPHWFREALGVYTSLLNACAYCVEHHYVGMKNLMDNPEPAPAIREALEQREPEKVFEGGQLGLMRYAHDLTTNPSSLTEARIVELRELGVSDACILEANQIVAYFCYANRTVLGLGVNHVGETLGMSPSSSESDDWSHK